MNTQQAIAFFTQQSGKLTQSLAALDLGNNGETVVSLQTKVDQAVKTAFGKREQLSSKLDTLTAKARQAEDKLSLAAGNQSIEQERLAELQRQQSELEITIKGLQDRKQVLSANGDSKKAGIKAEIATIKANISKTEAEVGLLKKQIADGLGLVASYDSLRQQAQTAQEQANYHNQYVQYWGKVGEEKKRSGGHKDIYGWITNTAQVNARDSFQAQANQFTQQAAAIQGQVDSFKQSLPVLEGTKNSKTDQVWLYYQELDAKNNVLSFVSTQSGNDLALLDLQLSQSQTDLTQLKNTDIPSQKTITDGTTQRVTQVKSELDQLKTQNVSAQKSLDSFNQSNKELLTTDLSLDLLQDSITKSQANIVSLQSKLATPNQSVSVINSLNLSLTNEQTKLGQLKQQYQLEALEVLAVNQDRLESLKGQLAAESSVSGAVKETTIGGYVVLVSQFADQLTGLSDAWAESLKENHQFTVEVSNLFDSNLTSFVGVKKFIEDNLATPYSDYVLNGIQLDEALAIQEAGVKFRDVLAKTVDDLQENIELQKKSVEQKLEIEVKLQHLQNLTKYQKAYTTLKNLALQSPIELSWLQSAVTNPNNGHIYLLTEAKTWTEAQSEATKLGGNLVSINNAEEQQWLWKNFSIVGNYWIGLKRNLSNNSWEWVNGETATYFNWDPDEPNNAGGIENYGMIIGSQDVFYDQGKWNDYSDTNSLRGNGIRGIIEISSQAVLDQKIKEQQQWIEIKAQGADTSTKLISELSQEITNKISDIPNQLDLPNDQQEQAIEKGLQKYVQQKENDILKTQAQQLASVRETFQQPTRALYFDGVNDYINVGVKPSLKVTTNLTLEAWINPQQDSRTRMIVGREGEYLLALSGADNIIHYAVANSNPGWTWVSTGYGVKSNQWSHIAFSFDNGQIKTYVNGQLIYKYDGIGTIGDADTNQNELRIGNRQWNNTDFFKGQIDEVRVWNVTRNQSEIQTFYNRNLNGKEQGLAGYWNFEESTGDKVNDLTVNNNQGTLTNGVQRTIDNLAEVKYQPSRSLYFDGINDYVNAGLNSSLKVSTNLTLEAWIKPHAHVGK